MHTVRQTVEAVWRRAAMEDQARELTPMFHGKGRQSEETA
jgi:hypothetical protein